MGPSFSQTRPLQPQPLRQQMLKKPEALPTITITASRADELSTSAKQVTKLDENKLNF